MKTKKAGTTAQTLNLDFPTTRLMFTCPLWCDFPPPAHAESFSLNVWEIPYMCMGNLHSPSSVSSGNENSPPSLLVKNMKKLTVLGFENRMTGRHDAGTCL